MIYSSQIPLISACSWFLLCLSLFSVCVCEREIQKEEASVTRKYGAFKEALQEDKIVGQVR